MFYVVIMKFYILKMQVNTLKSYRWVYLISDNTFYDLCSIHVNMLSMKVKKMMDMVLKSSTIAIECTDNSIRK